MSELTINDFTIGMQVVCIKDHPDRNLILSLSCHP